MEGRKRGGQKGNTNALKYGFYRRKLSRIEKTDLDKIETTNNMRDEILMLKVMIQRVWELASQDAKDLDRAMAALNVLAKGVMHESRLLMVQSLINGEDYSEISRAILEAVRKMKEEYDSYR